MEEAPIVLEVKNLSKSYGTGSRKRLILDNISFQIPLGKICCLLGPNGSGKTTLLKILAGLIEPDSGSIAIQGMSPTENPLKCRAHVGWMPAEERSGFYGRLTGRENLNFFGTLQGLDQAHMDRAIGNLALQLDMTEELDRTLLHVSSGIKQKVGLIRSMLHEPSIVLMDEPGRNLDPHTLIRLRRLIKNHLAKIQSKTILLSTHLLEEAKKTADMILILNQGKIVRNINIDDLETELKTSSVEDFYMKTIDEQKKP
ncbi:MAG: ABC transporter ATP-binding protein [Elusimicrobiota bacterium]